MPLIIGAAILAAVFVVLGSSMAAAGTLTIRTPSLVPDPDGFLNCRIEARGPRPLDVVAKIVTGDGSDVTDFGTSFRTSPTERRDGYSAEETAGSLRDEARACIVTVRNALRPRVRVILSAHDASGSVTASVRVP